MPDPRFHPWPGHPCANHGCDGCAICQAGGCCGSHAAVAPPPTARPLRTLAGQQSGGSLPTAAAEPLAPVSRSAKRGAAA